MDNFFEKDLAESFKTLQMLKEDSKCRIELIEGISDGGKLIKRTYCEDKREVFGILSRERIPHVAQIKAVIFNTDTVVLEEYIDGENLEEYLQHRAVSKKEAVRIVQELLCAVSGIHKLGIIHRDIKPDNIMVDKKGCIYLIDFGIARCYRPGETKDTQLLGTVGYAAPEQFGFSQSDFRTDIFSIGITCRDINQVCGKNRILRKIEKKCTRLDPAERYPDIDSMLAEFKRWRLQKTGGGLFILLLIVVCFGLNRFLAIRNEDSSGEEKIISSAHQVEEGIIRVPHPERIFSGQETAPCILLAEDTSREAEITLAGQSEPIRVKAALNEKGLSMSVINALNEHYEFLLSNQADIPESYPDTSLYGEILFYDTDLDGIEEIWVAVSDRKYITLRNGVTVCNKNYVAGWCIYCDENNDFKLAEGQMTDAMGLEIDRTLSGGIWLEDAFGGYTLREGALEPVFW